MIQKILRSQLLWKSSPRGWAVYRDRDLECFKFIPGSVKYRTKIHFIANNNYDYNYSYMIHDCTSKSVIISNIAS